MKITNNFISSDGVTKTRYVIYKPECEPKAIVQMCHGMCEYFERYEPFAEYLCEKGYLVYGHDHLGHGEDSAELGFFASENGWKYLVKDVHKMFLIVREQYPSLSTIIIGHSMGSFVLRNYLAKYPDSFDGAIIMGTSGKNPLNKFAINLANNMKKKHGEKYRSKKLASMTFLGYNKRFEKASEFAWLAGDSEVYFKYEKNPLNNFIFTVSGYVDLFTLLNNVSSKRWVDKLSKETPFLLMSGEDDPVGNYGRGVKQVYSMMKSGGCNVEMKLYPKGRHEILNDYCKGDVYKDVLEYIEEIVK